MALTFESTHEYFVKDACVWYSEEMNALVTVDGDRQDRVVVCGINKDSLLKMAKEIVQKSFEKEVMPEKETTSTK
tara:strand:- start:207 stop:431 length:225 start_codon:yes stop_codon:yes gene_type:complete